MKDISLPMKDYLTERSPHKDNVARICFIYLLMSLKRDHRSFNLKHATGDFSHPKLETVFLIYPQVYPDVTERFISPSNVVEELKHGTLVIGC